jgi:hypothetical protein
MAIAFVHQYLKEAVAASPEAPAQIPLG